MNKYRKVAVATAATWLVTVLIGCSYPDPVDQVEDKAIDKLLTELDVIKSQLSELEGRLVVLEGEKVRVAENNQEAGEEYVDAQSADADIEWLRQYTRQFENQTSFHVTDPQIDEIAGRFEGQLEQLITYSLRDSWQPYVSDAIRKLLTDENENLILEYLDTHDDFVDLAYERGLHITHPSYFYSALETRFRQNSDYIPTALIGFAAENDLERFRVDLEDYAVSGPNVHATFEELAKVDYEDLAALAELSFARLGLGDTWEDANRAFVAAKYAGNSDALKEFLSICLSRSDREEDFFNCETRDLIRHPGTLEDIHALIDQFEYRASGKYWLLPS